jgi:DNA-binding CsgD family transcriptional regulator
MDNEFLPLTLRLRAILSQAQMSDFQRNALRLLEQRVPVAKQTHSAGVEQLTQREITVLRYLASRYTVSEIAQELFVSINTLKTHTKAVYRKLGVSSRREAIAEARRLKIL